MTEPTWAGPTAPARRRRRPEVQRDFRLAMPRVAAPVSIVTVADRGRALGATVSALDSLSMSPPMMTVALLESRSLLAVVRAGTRLGVNVLTSSQAGLAATFATSVADRFSGVDWWMDDGVPRLQDVHAWFALRVRELVRGGDHVVVVGDVLASARGTGAPQSLIWPSWR